MIWPVVPGYTSPVLSGKVSKERIDKTEGELTLDIQVCDDPENSAEFYSLTRDGGLSEDDFDTDA